MSSQGTLIEITIPYTDFDLTKAVLAYRAANLIVRLEHPFDDSRGSGGGFYRGADALTPSQHLLALEFGHFGRRKRLPHLL